MPRVVTVDTTNSTVTVFPASIEDDGVESATVTVTLLNTDGNPMPTRAVTISSTGSGNTITQPVGVTNQQGVATGSIVSTGAGAKTISAATLGVTLTDTASLSVQTAGGTVATFTDISRDASNTNGGDTVLLTVSTIVGTPEVRFNGILATDITEVNATTISCVVPASLSTGVVDVVCGGVGLTNPRASIIGGDFEYLPVASTVQVDADFNSGSLPSSMQATAGSDITVQTGTKYSGTHAVRAAFAATGVSGVRNTPNVTIADFANGIYLRYYQFIPTGTASTWGDQVKLSLFRLSAGSGQPGWIMSGVGPDFNDGGSDDTLVSFLDNGVVEIGGAGNPEGRSGIAATNQWNEWLMWHSWDAGASEGRVKTWLNGKLQYDVSDSVLGGSGSYRFTIGIGYVQNPTGTVEVFIDDVFMGDGFPNAVEP